MRDFQLFARLFSAVIVLIVCVNNTIAVAQDQAAIANSVQQWPQWRGANLDNTSTESNLPVEFSKDKNMVWRFELPGPGGASPIVWNDTVFVTSVVDEKSIWLHCVGKDGVEIWRKQLQGTNQASRDGGNSASPSPSTDGKHVWAMSTAGFIECFDYDGNLVWSVDLQERYGEFKIQFGMTSTAILDEGKLYLQLIHGEMRDKDSTSVGTIVALEAATGKQIWRHDRATEATFENKHSYASPIVIHTGNSSLLVTHGGDYVMGHSLDDGTELWRCGGLNSKDNYNPTLRFVASPMFAAGELIVPSAKNGPVISLDIEKLSGDVTESQEAFNWRLEKGTPDVATPVIANGMVFLARESGVMMCLDAESGEEVYSERLFADRHRSTPVVAGDHLYLAGRDGTVLVLATDRKGTVLARNELGEETLASPAISNGKIYVRTMNALYCFGK